MSLTRVEGWMVEAAGLEAAPNELTRHRPTLNALTGIRFFAAGYVVVFHSRVNEVMAEHGHRAAANFFANGFLAVPLFFLLSGFILAYTYRGQIETGAARKRFWEARFARIWPAYMVSLLAMTTATLAFPPLSQVVSSVLMVQSWDPADIALAGAWNMVCWTLSVEALFYLVFPWTQRWLESLQQRGQLVWLAGMLALCVVLNTPSRTLGYDAHGIWRYVPLAVAHVPEFFVGMGLGTIFLERRDLRLPGRGAWTYGAAAVTVVLLCLPVGRLTGLIVLGFAPLLYGLAAESTSLARLLSTRLLIVGGEISYAMYLMQMVVKTWVMSACQRLGIAGTGARLGLNAVVLLVVAYAVFHLVENPARLGLRRVFARMNREGAAG